MPPINKKAVIVALDREQENATKQRKKAFGPAKDRAAGRVQAVKNIRKALGA